VILFAGLLLVFVFEYVRPDGLLPLPPVLNSVIPLTVLALTLFQQGKVANGDILRDKNGKLLLFYMFLMTMSIFTADVSLYAFNKFKAVLGYIFMFYMIARLVTDMTRMRLLFATLVLVHVLLVLLNPNLILNPEIRSYIKNVTFLGDGNDFSLSVAIVIPMCFYLILHSEAKWIKLIFIAAMMLLFFSIIGASSRGAGLAIAAVLLYELLKSRRKVVGLFALGLVVTVVLAYAPPTYFKRMESIAEYETEGSAQGRIIAWKAAMRMAADHPMTGVGAGNFPTSFGTGYRPIELGIPWLTAHSVYFLTLGELGYPGILFLIAIIVSNLWANERRIREAGRSGQAGNEVYRSLFITLNASLIAFAVAGAFLSAIYYPHLYVLAGLMTAAHFIHERDTRAAQEAAHAENSRNDTNNDIVPGRNSGTSAGGGGNGRVGE